MSSIGLDVLTNLVVAAIIFALGWITRVPLLLLIGAGARRRKLQFFGVTKEHPRQIIYLSTLFVPQFGARDFRNEARSFAGPAVPEYELDAVKLFDEIWRHSTLDSLSARTRASLARFWRLRPILPGVVTSPRRTTDIQRGGSIVCVGSQFYNSATALYFTTLSPTLRINDNGTSIDHYSSTREVLDQWAIRPAPIDQAQDFGIVERLVVKETATVVFVVAGLGTVGTTGAMTYLVQQWRWLQEEYGDGSFAICLGFKNVLQDPDAHLKPQVVFKTEAA